MNVRTAKLYDSNTADMLTARDLHITRREYIEAVRESRDCGTAEGHVLVDGRRVYAQ